ncbi:hypothetical protein A3Q56_03199, partial [Intoshia linei]
MLPLNTSVMNDTVLFNVTDDAFLHPTRNHIHKDPQLHHFIIMIFIFCFILLFQYFIHKWKTTNFKSYQFVTLIVMYVIPLLISIRMFFIRFIFISSLYFLGNIYIIYKALQKPIDRNSPRLVYKWFIFLYSACYHIGIISYAIIIFSMLGITYLVHVDPANGIDLGILGVFYAVYFGIVSRDIADICTNKMAVNIGYISEDSIPARELKKNICSLCSNELDPSINPDEMVDSSDMELVQYFDRNSAIKTRSLDEIEGVIELDCNH